MAAKRRYSLPKSALTPPDRAVDGRNSLSHSTPQKIFLFYSKQNRPMPPLEPYSYSQSSQQYNVLIRDVESTCPHCGKTNKSYFDHNRARIGILNEQPVVAVDCSKCHKHYVYRVMAFEPKLQYYAPTAAPNIEQIRKSKEVLSSLPDDWTRSLDFHFSIEIADKNRVTMAEIFQGAFGIKKYSHQDSMKVGKFMKNRGWRRTRRLIGDKRKYEYFR